jgi:hypothetical protein
MSRWYERMRDDDPALYAELFPRGQADVADFLDRVDEQERRYGIPAKCEHVPTLLRVARIVAA